MAESFVPIRSCDPWAPQDYPGRLANALEAGAEGALARLPSLKRRPRGGVAPARLRGLPCFLPSQHLVWSSRLRRRFASWRFVDQPERIAGRPCSPSKRTSSATRLPLFTTLRAHGVALAHNVSCAALSRRGAGRLCASRPRTPFLGVPVAYRIGLRQRTDTHESDRGTTVSFSICVK